MKLEVILLIGVLFAFALLIAQDGLGNAMSLAIVGGKQQNGFQKLMANAAEFVFFTADEMAKKLEDLGKDIGKQLEKVNEQVTQSGKASEDTKTELKNATDKFKETADKHTELIKKQQEQLDDLEKKAGKLGTPQQPAKNFETELKSILETNVKFKEYKNRNSRSAQIEMGDVDLFQKASTITTAGALTQTTTPIILPTQTPGIVYQPDRRVHVRELLPVGTTNAQAVAYVEESALTNGVASVAEGASKPQSDFTLISKLAPVIKIATFLRVSEEMLDDLPGLTSYITVRFSSKLKLEEDRQMLTGSGAANNLTGLITAASSYNDVLGNSGVNPFDVLIAAITQIAVNEYAADYILLHPRDYMRLAIAKGSDGHYVFPGAIQGGPVSVFGVPIVSSTMVAYDTFLVGDFKMGAMIFDRKSASIRFYDQDADNATKNLVTIVIEERLAMPIYRPTAFVTGSINAALANGSA